MALVIVVTYCTPENQRFEGAARCLESVLDKTYTFAHHFVVVDNASTDPNLRNLLDLRGDMHVFETVHNKTNLGTAKAVNIGLQFREKDENVAVLDDDCVIRDHDWLELAEECFRRDPKIGLVGLKRVDLAQSPTYEGNLPFRTTLEYLPKGKSGPHKDWNLIFEASVDVMGTAHIVRSEVIDAIGGWYQHGVYGFDDGLLCERVRKGGWRIGFLPQIRIEHWDPHPSEAYRRWKREKAGEAMQWFMQEREKIRNGTRSIYYDPKND